MFKQRFLGVRAVGCGFSGIVSHDNASTRGMRKLGRV